MLKIVFILFMLLPNLAIGQFFNQPDEEVLAEDNIYEEGEDFGVPTDRELNRRIQQLRKKVQELELRVKHLESQGDMKALTFYQCTVQAGLVGSHSARADSEAKAQSQAIAKCRKASGNSALCSPENMQCKKE